MLNKSTLFLSFLLLLCAPAGDLFAKPVTFNLSERYGKKQIIFESKAPLEYIEGMAEGVNGTLFMDPTLPNLGLRGTVFVSVASMNTGHPQRNEHLQSVDWMNAPSFPSIRFDLGKISERDVVPKGDRKWFVNVTGDFYMKGISKTVKVPVTLWIKKSGDDEKIYIQGRFSLKLSDFSIRGPVAIRMIGLRVSDTVNVDFKIVGVADKGWGNLPPRTKKRLR